MTIFLDKDKTRNTLSEIVDPLENFQELKLEMLSQNKTALVIVDMVNGFASGGQEFQI